MTGLVVIHSDLRRKILCFNDCFNFRELLLNTLGLSAGDFFVTCNGKLVSTDSVPQSGLIYHVAPRILGGKGGFGSMLRAIGAQIEKTTSREACRDLSGRRMRDVNNEKKLKEWIAKQADREREKEEKRKERLAKRQAPVQHHFNDPTYADQRGKVLENLEDALQKGLAKVLSKPGPSSTVTSEMITSDRKRKACPQTAVKAKKSREWLGLDPDALDSEESEDDTSSGDNKTQQTETTMSSPENSTDSATCSVENGTELNTGDGISEQLKTECNPETSETIILGSDDSKIKTEGVDGTNVLSDRSCASSDIKMEPVGVDNTQADLQTIKTEGDVQHSTTDLKMKTEKDENCCTGVPEESTSDCKSSSVSTEQSLPVSAGSTVHSEDQQMKKEVKTVDAEPVDLALFDSASELEELGLDRLKAELMRRGLKCGGTLQQRAERLFSVKGLELHQIDPSLFSKPQKGKAKNKK